MATKHTPGLWEVDREKTSIVRMGGYFRIEQTATAETLPTNMTTDELIDESDANAKLIAAAPDLLNACIEAFKLLQNDPVNDSSFLQTAIDKATK